MVYDKREALLPLPYPKSPIVPPGIQHGHSMIIIRLFTVPYFSVRSRDRGRLTINGGHLDFQLY